jgi:hypothetical protein
MNRTRIALLLALAALVVLLGWMLQRATEASDASEARVERREVPAESVPSFGEVSPATTVLAGDGSGAAVSPAAAVLAPPDTATMIAGSVSFPDGTSVGAGVRVVAWRGFVPPTAAQLEGDSAPPSAQTDEFGHFCITGLAAGELHRIRAVGRGLYSLRSGIKDPRLEALKSGVNIDGVAAGTLDAALVVARIYGVKVLIRDENGEPPVTNPAFGRRAGYSQPKGSFDTLPESAPLLELAGLREEDRSGDDPDAWMMLCLAGAQPPEPLATGGQVAGYERYKQDIPLGPLSEGLPTVVIRIHRLCEVFARLRVECLGTGPRLEARPELPARGRRREELWVEMSPVDETGKAIGFRLRLGALPWSGVAFDQIPVGRYNVRLWSPHRFLSVPHEDQPMQPFEVFPGDNLLNFDVGALGALELDVRSEDGTAWQHQLNLELYDEKWGGQFSQNASFLAPPYLIEALPVGRYRVKATWPVAAQAEGDADGYVTVDGLGLQHVPLRLLLTPASLAR